MATHNNIVFRKSTRIILRPTMREDIPTILRWINDPDVTQYTNAHLPFMEAAEYAWFDALHTHTDHDIVVAIIAVKKNKRFNGI